MSGLEVLGAAASIAGILGLAGQSIKAAVALHDIYKDITTASESLRSFLQGLNALIRVLNEVQNVIQELELMSTPFTLASVQIQLDDCNKDIYNWLQVAERINPEFSTGSKETWKKFKTAIHKTYLMDVREQIAAHYRNINLSLGVLGRGLDIRNARKLDHMGENVKKLSSTSHSLLHQIDSNAEKLEHLSSSSESVLSLSVANSRQLEELSTGLERVERILRSQGSVSSISDQDEFHEPHQFLQKPPSEAISIQEKNIEPLLASLTLEDQDLIVSNVENRLSECAFDFVAKYQLPLPTLIRYPMDRGWADWVHLLKRLALRNHIPAQILGNRQLESFLDILEKSVHRDHEVGQTWPTRHQQSLPQDLDDWYILQIISSSIRVAQFLKDFAAMEYLTQLYQATMDQTQRSNAAEDNLTTEGRIDFADGIDPEDGIDSKDFSAEIFDFLLSLGERQIKREAIESLGGWPNKRDQINNWLLESLQCSNVAASLHRLTLMDQDVIYLDEKMWARQVLKFWSLDAAGVWLDTAKQGLPKTLNSGGSSGDVLPDPLQNVADIFLPISAYSGSTEKVGLSEVD